MEENKLFKRYKVILAGLCHYCARLARMKEAISNGEVVAPEQAREICKNIEFAKNELLAIKEQLGYSDGLAFMEDNNFAGFHVKDGVITGDTSLLLKIVTPWYNAFPEHGNNYQYEVACYLLAGLTVKEDNVTNKKEERKRHGAGVFQRLTHKFFCKKV